MKRLHAAALILAALIALSACSRTPGEGPSASFEPTAVPTASPAPTDAPVPDADAGPRYTLRVMADALPESWDPQQAVSQEEIRMASLYTGSLMRMGSDSLENGGLRFEYELAESVRDVTDSHRGDLILYGTSLGGRRASGMDSGFVFEIRLRRGIKWANGDPITPDDFIYSMRAFSDPDRQKAGANAFAALAAAPAGFRERLVRDPESRGLLGLYKADERTLICVTEGQVSLDEFKLALCRPVLVHPAMQMGLGTVYGSAPDYMLCSGPYKLEAAEDGTAHMTRSPYWRGWTQDEDSSMMAYTGSPVDGLYVQRFMATDVVIETAGRESAKQSFLSGEADVICPDAAFAAELPPTAELYAEAEPTVYSLVFNTDPEALAQIEAAGDRGASVLLNANFRKGISLAADREAAAAELDGAALLGLIPDACVYGAFSNPVPYRRSDAAARALRSVYLTAAEQNGMEDDALDADTPTGASSAAAAACFAQAFAELTEAGSYNGGDGIFIRVACGGGRVPKSVSKAVDAINRSINAAAEGAGFGRITLECVGGADAFAVARGEYAMGWSVTRFDALHPFEGLLSYVDRALYPAQTAGFDPQAAKLEMAYAGAVRVMDLTEWAKSLTGGGEFAFYPDSAKLPAAAAVERELLLSYCRIPVAQGVGRTLLSDRVTCIKRSSDPFTGRGGAEFIAFNAADVPPDEAAEE